MHATFFSYTIFCKCEAASNSQGPALPCMCLVAIAPDGTQGLRAPGLSFCDFPTVVPRTWYFAAYTVAMHVENFAHPPRNVKAFGLQPGMSVADFGSGSGAYVELIATELSDSGHVYAIDIQKDLLRRTYNEAKRKNHHSIKVLWGDLESPGGSKIADTALDFVLISNLLFQIDDKPMVLAEAFRVLKHRGRLAIIDWSESFGGMGPEKGAVCTEESARSLAEQAGLTFEKSFTAGAHHYGLIFRKP